MEWWNNGIIAFHALIVKEKAEPKPAVPTVSAAGVFLPEGRHPIIPVVSAANLSSGKSHGLSIPLTRIARDASKFPKM
jgi:hypothetical protein